ncbi:histidinol-phosphate transaminase [Aliiroseovarius sp.]|uniref:histidinol-phosphate transaminase n=1 Tax=Aliiroseovarius sp. TaxID=1872442 RepID=UPI0026244A9D|nr:histidinol-phosphate transaminase [Aliiroseovarius sp.]
MSDIKPQPGILEIAPYQGGASKIEGVSDVVKLSSNENPFGPSDKAMDAFRRASHDLHRYPNTHHTSLRTAIADQHGLDVDRIICGVGSDEIIAFLCQAYAGVGDEVIYTEHGFSMYRISALAAGATPVMVGETDRVVDVDKILAGCTRRTRLVFIANPGNPTGTMVNASELKRLADSLPGKVLLVLDGAYAEFEDGYDGGASLVDSHDNVVMTRTFSKAYGLGGLRVGWGYGPAKVIDVLNRIRGPFNLSEPQLATAEAALRDRDHVERCIRENDRLRVWLRESLTGHGLDVDESHANFLLVRFADETEAVACDEALKAEGLIVRRVGGYGFPEALRITVGDESACRRVAHVIGRFRGAVE